ncbi:putative chitinase [Saccharomycopsis crataegensis]|uniref:chitinase n=1 Tax=Saccharomycopsis crataegensis TaxID=43959 RepID=A0AAV5QG20_9ASCO|nr:putative chitinase [Saccharomycopsis crataegensis]
MVPQHLRPEFKLKTCLYYSNWSIYSKKFTPDKLPFHLITNLFYSFMDIDPHTGAVILSDKWADIEVPFNNGQATYKGCLQYLHHFKSKYRHLKLSMSIGGWSFRDNFKNGISTDEKINNFANTAIKFLTEYGFDGIDLDFEYPENEHDATQYVKLAQRLRSMLKQIENEKHLSPGSLLLTLAIPAMPESLRFFKLHHLDQYVSFYNVMTYDFAGSWSNKVQLPANTTRYSGGEWSVNDTVSYLLENNPSISPKKYILGVPAYGKVFRNAKGLQSSFSNVEDMDFKTILNTYLQDPQACQNKMQQDSIVLVTNSGKDVVCFDTLQSVRNKARIVVDNRLGGMMWWEACGDGIGEHSLVKAFVFSLANGPADLDGSINNVDYRDSKYLSFK